MNGPTYPNARTVATTVEEYFTEQIKVLSKQEPADGLAVVPNARIVETIIETAFWASLRREEDYSPKISLAFVPPGQAEETLSFENQLPFNASVLTRLAPAVERPGIHLGVWPDKDFNNDLHVWGTTRRIPKLCFVLEVIEPGLLVVKYRRGSDAGKYVNVVVLKGDQIKLVDQKGKGLLDCPALLTPLLGFGSQISDDDPVSVLVQLSASMRAHGRGGSLLVVPQGTTTWRNSILPTLPYSVAPPYTELAELMRKSPSEKKQPTWQEDFIDAVDAIAGLTAVDGAAVITDQYEVLAFGAKIGRRDGGVRVDQVVVTEPLIDAVASVIPPLELGGTRHLSAAQFVQDQNDAVALVASQDGRFTIFAWSPCEGMVHAHRAETLLL